MEIKDSDSTINADAEATSAKDGEYTHRSGYTQRIYSDANYMHPDEYAEPTRFYTPSSKPEKNKEHNREKNNIGPKLLLVLLCMICGLLGGLIGFNFAQRNAADSIEYLNSQIEGLRNEYASLADVDEHLYEAESEKASDVQVNAIYLRACNEVVGITSEITYTSFFGYNTSTPVSGTGIFVSSEGHILTNYHVIEAALKNHSLISAVLYDGSSYEAEVLGYDETGDLALLKVGFSPTSYASFADSNNIHVGDEIFAVGNPLGELDFSMTFGHISALDRIVSTDDSAVPINMFQIDAAVNSGNSGGPVYDVNGHVIGIVSAKYSQTGVEGLGFAIPANDASKAANDIITKGYVTGKPYIGILIDQHYNSLYSFYYGIPMGVYVNSIVKGSAAETAGINKQDIIIGIDEFEITSENDLKYALSNYSYGDVVTIHLYRDGEECDKQVTFEELKSGYSGY